MNHNKSIPRRRRSGIDMMSSKLPVGGDLAGGGGGPPVVKTRLPKIAKSSRATGIWSRKISPAGVSYLKMDDEVSHLLSEKYYGSKCLFHQQNCRRINLFLCVLNLPW